MAITNIKSNEIRKDGTVLQEEYVEEGLHLVAMVTPTIAAGIALCNFGRRIIGVDLMIRILKPSDIDAVMNIWLSSNIQAHSFIPREYWMKYFGQVKEMLPDATVYVYEDNGSVQGFIGLTKNYIEGIFVEESMRGKGIGTQLLNLAKQLCSSLTLQVYEKNQSALRFYFQRGISNQKETNGF